MRSNRHVSAQADCRADLLRYLTAALVREHTGRSAFEPPVNEIRDADARVSGHFGGRVLWDVGLHPSLVPVIHAVVSPRAIPLPVSFYLGVITERPDLMWIRRTIDGLDTTLDDEQTVNAAEWLAWSQTEIDAGHPDIRREFLALGITWPDIQQLTSQRVLPDQIKTISRTVGLSPTFAADSAICWLDAGVMLDDPSEFAWLLEAHRLDVSRVWRPSKAVLQALKAELRATRHGLSTGQLCAVLGVAGTVHFAAAAIRQGITSPSEVHAWLHADAFSTHTESTR